MSLWCDFSGDFIGEKSSKDKQNICTMSASVDTKKTVDDLRDSVNNWLREEGYVAGKTEKVLLGRTVEGKQRKILLKTSFRKEGKDKVIYCYGARR